MIKEQQLIIDQLRRIIEIFVNSEAEIRPHFMMTGPSGSGKSHIAKLLADQCQVPYFEINAAQLTKEGTSGNSLSKALGPLAQKAGGPCICFVDEFDKLFISGNANSDLAHETTNGVQNEFLRVLESSHASVFGDYGKYVDLPVDNVLFIFAGAFNGEANITIDRLREFGIKTEFLGRVGLVYNLEKLSLESMYYALQNSEVLANYLKLFPEADKQTVINEIMQVVEKTHEKNTLGIRLLTSLLNQYFISGGILSPPQIESIAFTKTLQLKGTQQ